MHRRHTRSLLAIALVGTGAIASLAYADELILVNGDRLTGRLLHKAADVVTFDTAPAGPLKIKWSDVVALSTDRPVDVRVVGEDRTIRTILSSAYDGSVDFIGSESDVPLVKISYINPTPEESGVGAIYTGHVTATAVHVRGNVDTDQQYADTDFTARSKDYRYTLAGKFSENRERRHKIASNWLLTGNYDRFLSEKRFLYLRGSRESDRFKGVDRRSTVGGGYGFQVIETLRTNVALRVGADYVVLNRLPPGEDERYPALGWGARAIHKLTDRGTELFHEHDGFFNLQRTHQFTVRSRTGVRVPLFIGLNASAQFNLDWDSDPIEGRKPLDATLLLGLGYAW